MKIRHLTSLWTSVGVAMKMPPFTMTLFQSAHGQVAVKVEGCCDDDSVHSQSHVSRVSLQFPCQRSEGKATTQ